jgi:hypothetical protein
VVSAEDSYGRNLGFLDGMRYFFSYKQYLSCTQKAGRTPIQTQYFLESQVAPGIEPRPLDHRGDLLSTLRKTNRNISTFYVYFLPYSKTYIVTFYGNYPCMRP